MTHSYRPFAPAAMRRSVPLDQGLADADAVVILTGHTAVDYARVVDRMRVVVDAVNVTSHLSDASDRVIRLGAPMPASLAGD